MAKYVFAAKDGSGDITDSTGKVVEFTKLEDAEAWAEKNGVDPAEFDIDQLSTTTPEQIKARGEAAYKTMMEKIEARQVKETYGDKLANPLVDFGMAMVAPSSHESIRSGKMPDWGDVAIDVGLAGLTLLPPLKGATIAGTVGKNVAAQGAIAGASEDVMSAKHDRPYNLSAPVVGAVGGGVVGGVKSRELAQIGKVVPPESVPFIEKNIGSIPAFTKSNLRAAVPQQISDIAVGKVSPAAAAEAGKQSITLRGQTGMEFADDVRRAVTSDIKTKLLNNSIDDAQARNSIKLLDDFEAGVLTYAQHNPDSKVSLDNMLMLAQRMYKQDPSIGTAIINELEPQINRVQREAAQLEKMLLNSPVKSVTKPTVGSQVANVRAADEYVTRSADKLSPPGTGWVKSLSRSPEALRNAEVAAKHITPRAALAYPAVAGGATQTKDADGNLLYAPRGTITWDDLWADAPSTTRK